MYNIRNDVDDDMKSLSDVVRKGRRVRDISDVQVSAFELVMSGGAEASRIVG